MATSSNTVSSFIPGFERYSHLAVPLAVVGILMILIIPLPTILLDFFISIAIILSVVILLVSMYILQPVEFSVFPSLLLLITLYRLSLNVATTRLILLNGGEGVGAAGHVIQSFGQFVVGGNTVVGIVIFLVLIAIQYIVINHGAVRISEVTARFTLDAMPGKQVAIDADLNAGIIDEHEARRRRREVQKEAEFYGAMDGAIRFTQRDAVAAIIILLINIVGGFIIGVMQHNMTLSEALQTYTVLTVGDGLVTAIPALLVSVAGGLVTTRAASETNLGDDVTRQLLLNPRPLYIASAILLGLAIVPGLPKLPFFLLSLGAGGLAYIVSKKIQQERAAQEQAKAEKAAVGAPQTEKLEQLLKLDMLGLEVGYGLIQLVESGGKGDLLSRIKSIRRQIAIELGIIVPPIHITDNLQLGPKQYAILLKGVEVARGELMVDHYLAINPGSAREEIPGIVTSEPAFGLPALWIKASDKDRAQFAGYTVVDPVTVVSTHISETIKRHAFELLGRQETKSLLDALNETHPKVVEECVPKVLSIGEVQRVLQNLLREGVSIRDLVTILETLADYGALTRDVNVLTEYVRQALARQICKQYADENGELHLLTLSPQIDQLFSEAITQSNQGTYLALEPKVAQGILSRISEAVENSLAGNTPVLLCSAAVRSHLKRLTERFIPNLVVLSHNEITPNIRIVSIGVVQ